MTATDSFLVCMARLKEGESLAEYSLYGRYVRRLVALADSRLQAKLSSKLDPEDVVQSVFRSFFIGNSANKFSCTDWEGLWALLARITVRKCTRRAVRLATAKRDCNREESAARIEWQLVSSYPTPEQAAEVTELIKQVLSSLDPPDQEILLLKLARYTNEEISERVGRSERTVYRKLLKIRSDLSRSEFA